MATRSIQLFYYVLSVQFFDKYTHFLLHASGMTESKYTAFTVAVSLHTVIHMWTYCAVMYMDILVVCGLSLKVTLMRFRFLIHTFAKFPVSIIFLFSRTRFITSMQLAG